MPAWPFWLLFFATGGVALAVVTRLDDLERGDERRERERKEAARGDRT